MKAIKKGNAADSSDRVSGKNLLPESDVAGLCVWLASQRPRLVL